MAAGARTGLPLRHVLYRQASRRLAPPFSVTRFGARYTPTARYPLRNWSFLLQRVKIVGFGRVGTAVAGRLREHGFVLDRGDPELVLLCVPDRAIREVAGAVEPGPWIAHTSGATPLAALDPHERRFGIHPLQTFTRTRGPEQLDGAYAAITSETDEAREVGFWLAGELGLEPFALDDSERALYHAGAVVASNFLVTLHRAA